MADLPQCAIVLVLQENILRGEEGHLVLLLAHRKEKLHVDFVQPVLVDLSTALFERSLHLHLGQFQFFKAVVLLKLVYLDLVVAIRQYLLLTYADLRLELREVLVPSDPVVELPDSLKGRELLCDGQELVMLYSGLKVVGEVELYISKVEQFPVVEDVSIGFFLFSLEESALSLEVVAIIVVFKEVLVLFCDLAAISGVFDEHWHQCKHIDAFQIQIVPRPQFQLVVQTYGDSLNLEVIVQHDQLLVLLVALQHDYVVDISSGLDELLVELKAGIQITSLGDREDLLHGVVGLVVALSFLDPVEEHRVVELDNRGRHEYVDGGVDDFLGVVVEVALKEVADLGNDHLLFIALGVKIAGVLLEQHDGVEQLLFLGGLVHEVVARLENRVIFHAVPEVLYHGWLYLLIFYEDGEANVVELPSPVDIEVVAYLPPLC